MKVIFFIVEFLLRFIVSTCNIKIVGETINSPAIIAFWHGTMLPVWRIFSDRNAVAVVSQSKDGQYLSNILTKWNYELVRGSSSKGGSLIIKHIVNDTKSDYFLITPDGPRGPNKKCKPGIFIIAKKKQIPICFVDVQMQCKKRIVRSWDKFEIPLPFSKINITINEPIFVPQDANKEYISNLIEKYSHL